MGWPLPCVLARLQGRASMEAPKQNRNRKQLPLPRVGGHSDRLRLRPRRSLPVGAPIVYSYVLFTVLLPDGGCSPHLCSGSPLAHEPVTVALLIYLFGRIGVPDDVRLLHRIASRRRATQGHGRLPDVEGHQPPAGPSTRTRPSSRSSRGRRSSLRRRGALDFPPTRRRINANAATAVTLVRQPCSAGTHVAASCVIDPLEQVH